MVSPGGCGGTNPVRSNRICKNEATSVAPIDFSGSFFDLLQPDDVASCMESSRVVSSRLISLSVRGILKL